MSTKTGKFNKELLLKVKEKILENPEHFDMGYWVGYSYDSIIKREYYGEFNPENPACGTTACIAGWAMAIENEMFQANRIRNDIAQLASEILGLDYFTDANRLFYIFNWPQPFMDQYMDCETPTERSLVAAAYIDHFIEVMENGGFK